MNVVATGGAAPDDVVGDGGEFHDADGAVAFDGFAVAVVVGGGGVAGVGGGGGGVWGGRGSGEDGGEFGGEEGELIGEGGWGFEDVYHDLERRDVSDELWFQMEGDLEEGRMDAVKECSCLRKEALIATRTILNRYASS